MWTSESVIRRRRLPKLCEIYQRSTFRTYTHCTNDNIDDEVRSLNKTLMGSGYPIKMINRQKSHSMLKPTTLSAPKQLTYINLRLRNESNSLVLKQMLKSLINKTNCVSKVTIKEKTTSMLHRKPKQNVNDCVTYHCPYQLNCVWPYIHREE